MAAAVVSGLLIGASFPSVSLWPLIFVALVPLILVTVSARSGARAFLYGWIALTLSWLLTVPWVVTVMTKYGGLPDLTGVALYVSMCVVLGLYGGAFSWMSWRLAPGRTPLLWLLVPLAWAVSEYGRTYLLSGFPWNLVATTTVDFPAFAVVSSWIGPYGLGSLIIACSTVIAFLISTSEARSRRIAAGVGVVATITLIVIAGHFEVQRRNASSSGASETAAMIQPNIAQEMRWESGQLLDIFNRMMRMTREAAASGAKVIVWPESTVPLSFATTDFYREEVESITASEGVDVILGSVAEDDRDPAAIWNSAYLVSSGETKGRYDKIQLVPFGEYVPLRKVLFFAERLVRAVGEFRFGTSSTPLNGSWAYGPAICYEVVYPRLVGEQVRQGATVLVTVTNDAWFGESSAPVQHLRAVRLRAIETDRWFLRAATTGISAVIDPNGRVVESLGLNQEGIVYGNFAPRNSRTLYVRGGDWFAIASCAIVSAALLFRRKVHQR